MDRSGQLSEPLEFPMARAQGCPFDPPPQVARLQRDRPVSRVRIWDGTHPWLITRFDDVRAILADSRVSADTDLPGYPQTSDAYRARRKAAKSMLTMDDPDHAALRRLLTSSFTVKKMEALRPGIQQIVDGLIDEMLAGPQPADLVQAFALPVPSIVICELLGVPYEDRGLFHRISRVFVAADTTPEAAVAALGELINYLTGLVERKCASPGDDLFSRLAVEQLQNGRMTAREIAGLGQLLLVAGHETTANMIALGTAALLAHPDQLSELQSSDDPAVVASAVDELLRYLTITHLGRRRVATADIEIGGVLIQAGEGIIAAQGAANRDPSAFPDGDSLNIHSAARHHVAFGYGVHQCLGQPLARVELQVVYKTLFRRIPTLALAKPIAELSFKHDMTVYGLHDLPVVW
jgi:cytochrome P450